MWNICGHIEELACARESIFGHRVMHAAILDLPQRALCSRPATSVDKGLGNFRIVAASPSLLPHHRHQRLSSAILVIAATVEQLATAMVNVASAAPIAVQGMSRSA